MSKIEPEIIVIVETKAAQQNTLKHDFKNYELVTKQVKKGKGGILCGVKKNIGTLSVLEVTTVKNDNILSVKVSFPEISMRVVVAYGPQENDSVENKEDFFKDLSIEVEASIVNGDMLMLVGDLNSRIELVDGKVRAVSRNGKYLQDLVTNCDLNVLNFSEKCTGKWTHVIRKSQKKSVIDYVIVDNDLNCGVRDILIDEECMYTPFRRVTENNAVRAQYSDHNTIITKIEIQKSNKERETAQHDDTHIDSWILNDIGWKKFFHITSTIPCSINQGSDSNREYNKLEKYIKEAMDSSFKKRTARKGKVVSRNKEDTAVVNVLHKFMKLGKLQRKVAGVYVNIIKENNLNSAGKIRAEKVEIALKELSHDNKLSHNAFWKLKKSLNLKTEVGTSVVLPGGVEVYGNSAIKETYRNEFVHRLRTRTIENSLQIYEKLTNLLCKLYVEVGKSERNFTFTSWELLEVVKTLSKNKAPGPDGIPAEVFIHAGKELIFSITDIFNNIKITGPIPEKWNKVTIKTLFKNKGSPKDLENWRGVFLTPTITKLFERYLMRGSKEEVNNISKFQGGSRPNRSASDQLFLLRACIDHAKYMGRSITATFYDFKQCFDSMWLEDSTISLQKIGIDNDKISLIKQLNEASEIVIKTPVGNTREFEVANIVKQGTVLGPLLCSASTAECCDEHLRGGVNIGSANIKSLAYVDDILDVNETIEEASSAHDTVTKFTAKKRLELKWEKCAILAINSNKKTKVPVLMVDGTAVKVEPNVKYLGDIINHKGSNTDLVDDRVKRANGCIVNSFSMVQDITFGCHAIETTLLLYNSLFLATVLFNSQSWTWVNKKDTEKLKVSQMSYLKRIVQAPRSSPNALVLLELGVLPIEFEIFSRKLMFLQHILQLEPGDPVKNVYQEQRKYERERNWANEVKEIKAKVNITTSDDDICAMNKATWKWNVKKSVREAALNKLNGDSRQLKRVARQYTELKCKEYLLKFPADRARIAFAYRSGTLDTKCYRQYMYEDLVCRACGEGEEDLSHIVNKCKQTVGVRDNDCLDMEADDLTTINYIVEKIKTFKDKI